MSVPAVYYSVNSKGYVKHPNVQILGVQNYTLNLKHQPHSSLSTDREFENKSIIKEEEMEYDAPEVKGSQHISSTPQTRPFSKARQIMEKEQVNSVHLTPSCSNETQNLTHSCIANTPHSKGILKKNLNEIQKKNITSHQDDNEDKELYIELQKQRRLRRELQKNYKHLLSQMQRRQRTYSADLNNQETVEKSRKRQFSKRTLNYEKSQEGLISSYEQLQPSRQYKGSDVKTVKLKQPQKRNQNEYLQSEDIKIEDDQVSEGSNEYRKRLITQSSQQQGDYFRQQKQFQQKIIEQLQTLNKRITQIDQFLLEKEREEEKQRLNIIIKQKQKEIQDIKNENEQLRQKNIEEDEQKQGKEFQFLKKLTPTSIYFFLMIIMALVAMS